MQKSNERRATDAVRVPLDTMVELAGTDQRFDADGLNVSTTGLSMRTDNVPGVGTLLSCKFECPEAGESLEAEGEVVWTEMRGENEGEFGLRFTYLDPRAKNAIDDLVTRTLTRRSIDADEKRDQARLMIDGLASPIIGTVAHRADDMLTLTQKLPFLRLGQGLTVLDASGKPRRAELADVELVLRSNIPELVIQVMYDHAKATIDSSSLLDASLLTKSVMDVTIDSSIDGTIDEGDTVTDLTSPALEEHATHLEARSEESSVGLSDDEAAALRGMTVDRTREEQELRRIRDSLPEETAALSALDRAMRSEAGMPAVTATKFDFTTANARAKILWRNFTTRFMPMMAMITAQTNAFFGRLMGALGPSFEKAFTMVRTNSQLAMTRSRTFVLGQMSKASAQKAKSKRITAPAPTAQTAPRKLRVQGVQTPVVEETTISEKVWFKPAVIGSAGALGIGLAVFAFMPTKPAVELPPENIAQPNVATTTTGVTPTTAALAAAPVAVGAPEAAPVAAVDPLAALQAPSAVIANSPGIEGIPQQAMPQLPAAAAPLAPVAAALPTPAPAMPTALGEPSYVAGQLPPPTYTSLRDAPRPTPPQGVPANSPYAVDAHSPTHAAPAPAAPRPAALAPVAAPPAAAALVAPVAVTSTPTLSFGAANVPSPQSFTLHMTHPISNLTGTASRGGFVVQLVGGMSIDRAAPIKASNPFVDGAGIVNRGDRAELTIRFKDGTNPAYRVTAHGSTVEVTIARR